MDYEALIRDGQVLKKNKLYKVAMEKFLQVRTCKIHQTKVICRREIEDTLILHMLGSCKEGQEFLEANLDPTAHNINNLFFWLAKARQFLCNRKSKSALECVFVALEINSQVPQAYAMCGLIYLRLRNYALAISYCTTANVIELYNLRKVLKEQSELKVPKIKNHAIKNMLFWVEGNSPEDVVNLKANYKSSGAIYPKIYFLDPLDQPIKNAPMASYFVQKFTIKGKSKIIPYFSNFYSCYVEPIAGYIHTAREHFFQFQQIFMIYGYSPIMIGSLARGTAIEELHDIDFLIVPDVTSKVPVNLEEVMNIFREFHSVRSHKEEEKDGIYNFFSDNGELLHSYRVQNCSIGVSISSSWNNDIDDKTTYDIIPATRSDDGFIIYNLELNRYIETNPIRAKELIHIENQKRQYQLIPLIKILKHLNAVYGRHSAKKSKLFKSYHLELLVYAFSKSVQTSNLIEEHFPSFLRDCLIWIKNNHYKDNIIDNEFKFQFQKIGEDYEKISTTLEKWIEYCNTAIQYEKEQKLEESIQTWGCLFGSVFTTMKPLITTRKEAGHSRISDIQEFQKLTQDLEARVRNRDLSGIQYYFGEWVLNICDD